MSIVKKIRSNEAMYILKSCGFLTFKNYLVLASYFLLTLLNALIEGIGGLSLVNLFTKNGLQQNTGIITGKIPQLAQYLHFKLTSESLLLAVIILFSLRVVTFFIVLFLDEVIALNIRRTLQEKLFVKMVETDWSIMRDYQVGKLVGITTEEANITTKYIVCLFKTIYYALSFAVPSLMAFYLNFKITLLMAITSIPMAIILKRIFATQSSLSSKFMKERQGFAADIQERLTGLFQIKTENCHNYHVQKGLARQPIMARIELILGLTSSVANSFNVIIPVVVLFSFYTWIKLNHLGLDEFLVSLASIGMLGSRIVTQFNASITSYSNLARLSGSLLPVKEILALPPSLKKRPIPEPISSISLEGVNFSIKNRKILNNIGLNVIRGRPLVLKGNSGSGKTTLANIISGVYRPNSGQVKYVAASGIIYHAQDFFPSIGYVTQHIHLYQDSIRNNLIGSRTDITDGEVWDALMKVGAKDFITEIGGLDAVLVEAGRSLSGGQKRRLGIAKAILQRPDMLILDEITNDLDEQNKGLINKTIMENMLEQIVIIISHDRELHKEGDSFEVPFC